MELLTIQEVANILKMTRKTIYNYINGGQLKASKLGNRMRVKTTDLEEFLERGTEAQYLTKLK